MVSPTKIPPIEATVVEHEAASFRDPAGSVFRLDGRIFRTIAQFAAEDYRAVRDSQLTSELVKRGWLIESREVLRETFGRYGVALDASAAHIVEHPVLPFVSYPYEWSFHGMKAAALLHLDLHLELLAHGLTLIDASAYNVQFVGPRPIFIDILSVRRYKEGEYWRAHRQFCEQFLNPLLLRALAGVPHNAWYRGALEGISTDSLARLLKLRHKLSWLVLSHAVLPSALHKMATGRRSDISARLRRHQLPKQAFISMLAQLRRWIARLEPADSGKSDWSDYGTDHSYARDEVSAKRQFVSDFARDTRPRLLLDLGCNIGDYAVCGLSAGAASVVGFDSDWPTIDHAFLRAQQERLEFLPLVTDVANPSPAQGWRQAERSGFQERASADALLALAFLHHLVIGRNIPLDQAVTWLTRRAATGVIEFVPKTDPMIQRMLALRDDIFPDYTKEQFENLLSRDARVIRRQTVSATGRTLYWYDRR